jgi:anion-transporting  ArsA/GET3 family ATPase
VNSKVTEILEKKMIVVTGKGGSGKSLLSLALAHRLSAAGRKVWLVEMGRRREKAFTRLPELAGLKSASHKPAKVTLPGSESEIELSVLDPAQSLAEYVDLKLPTAGFAGLLLNNRVTASFLEVVPGLPDLVTLGKLWHSVTQAKNGPDVVVLDAPASGHAMALLRAPHNFKRITKVGPIHRDATQMAEFFSDPGQVAIALTTLPEEMSIQETLDLTKLLKEFPKPYIFVNRHFPDLPKVEVKDSLPYQAYEYARKRAAREKEALSALKSPAAVIPIFFPAPGEPPLYLRIAEAL